MRSAGLAVAAALAVLGACGTGNGRACTEIGAVSGVGVTVDSALAPEVTGLRLEVCFAGDCRTVPVELSPGADTVPGPCPSDADPDTACSASAVPNGTLVGFAEVADLPAEEIQIGATLTKTNGSATLPEIQLTARTSYPNGPDCPGQANQAAVVITPDGLVAG